MASRRNKTGKVRAGYTGGFMSDKPRSSTPSTPAPSTPSTSSKSTSSISRTRRPTENIAIPRNTSGNINVSTGQFSGTSTPTRTPSVSSRNVSGGVRAGYTGGLMSDRPTTPTTRPTTPTNVVSAVGEPPLGDGQIPDMPEKIDEVPAPSGAGGIVSLREAAEDTGFTVGFDEATGEVSLGGIPVDTSRLQLEDGTYVGTQEEVDNLINLANLGISSDNPSPDGVLGLRDYFASKNMKVGYDPTTKQVTVNGVPIDTSQMGLLDGTYYASQENLQQIENMLQQQQQGDAIQDIQTEGVPTGEEQIQQAEQDLLETVEENALLKDTALDDYFSEVKKLTNNLTEFKTQMMNAFNDYKPVYREEALNILRNAYGNPFQYDPNRDPALTQAMKMAEQRIMNTMNSRGLLNSTITRDNMAQALSNMIPQYEQVAYNRYLTEKQNQLKFADKLMQIDEQDYQRLKENINFNLETMQSVTTDNLNLAKETLTVYNSKLKAKEEAALQEVKNREKQLKRANDSYERYGFITNETSAILGLPVDTPTADVYKKILTEQGLNDRKAADILEKQNAREENFQNDLALIDYKEEIAEINQQEEDAKTAVAVSYIATLQGLTGEQMAVKYSSDVMQLLERYPQATQQIEAIRDYISKEVEREEKKRVSDDVSARAWAAINESRKKREQDKTLLTTSQMISTLNNIKKDYTSDNAIDFRLEDVGYDSTGMTEEEIQSKKQELASSGEIELNKPSINNPAYLESVLGQLDAFGLKREDEKILFKSITGFDLAEAEAQNIINQQGLIGNLEEIKNRDINPNEKMVMIENQINSLENAAQSIPDDEVYNAIVTKLNSKGKEKGIYQKYAGELLEDVKAFEDEAETKKQYKEVEKALETRELQLKPK